MRLTASIIGMALLVACQPEPENIGETTSYDPPIHRLDAPADKPYVEIQSVGEFPRRPEPVYKQIRLEKTVLVPMRDGVRLATDIYSPVGVEGPLPVVMIRLPYYKNRYLGLRSPGSDAHYFAGHGYHVVVQDMRGRFESEGDYVILKNDRDDGYDAIEWISKQPWSTGKVGTYGCSYLGENQILLSATRHPNHAAAIPQAAGGGYRGTGRQFITLDGGIPEHATGLGWFWRAGPKHHMARPASMSDEEYRVAAQWFEPWPHVTPLDFSKAFWHLPIVDIVRDLDGPASHYEDYVSHGPADPYWDDMNYANDDDQFDIPALHVNSWYDGGVSETMILFNLFSDNATSERGRDNQFAIISPTAHCASERQENWEDAVIGALPVGDISMDYFRTYLDWFDYWLKEINNGVTDMPKIQYYAMGTNEWRTADEWPLQGTEFRNYYLRSGGEANTRNGDGVLTTEAPTGAEPVDNYRYDPADPVTTLGGAICCISEEAAPAGAYDQASVEQRADVLVYTTEPLNEDLNVVGPITVTLYVSSSAKDTDFTAKLVDVYPDGTAYNIQDSILRARYREGFDKKVFMEPDGVYRIDLRLHATGNVFLKGHRVRLQVSSSNFPRFTRNLNTGGNNFDETEWLVADNTIHHSNNYPSHIVLPVVNGQEE
ncbi:MAG: CocE/NonD family hydrolase [Gammaproteobacteria bacterium]|nr:CocE/NonD family hydrolase [Gammaproteobacteria bacterium]